MDLKLRILVFVLQLHIATSYKSYKFNKLCPTSKFKAIVDALLDDKPNVELENGKDLSVALITQKWNDKTYKAVEYCDFRVIAKSSRHGPTSGIFASIRQMNLRKGASNECIDYVIFEVGSGENQKSQKMCGTVEGDEAFEASNFFDAPGGSMKVIIYINRYVALESGKELGIEFSFTSYDDCTRNTLECQEKKCISKDLQNDTILNCPPPFCRDEPSLEHLCNVKQTYQAPSSHVLAISALTSLFLVMFAIVTCWYCFKFRNWNDNQTNSPDTSARLRTSRPDMEFQTIRIPAAPEMSASAPPVMEDHDNPPSYDSLFKDRKVV
ncbi:hypothetical protein Bhyg_07785 [Pseudolycoriella hygida]|uniref:Uncharacterized protein n=1 Tax=Pseudolycoriella hygida TaxID=35572 RepID=A0A9Q0N4M0_9DIPT|nr:hypothetical protein Bhyg_07785 [Pseudolycoriella hygida]